MPPKKASKADANKGDSALSSRTKKQDQRDVGDRVRTRKRDIDKNAEQDSNGLPEGPKSQSKRSSTEADRNNAGSNDPNPPAHAGQKRKKPPPKGSKSGPRTKTPRQGSRSSTRNKDRPASPAQLLNFLLSPASLPYCFPEDELHDAQRTKAYKSYSLTSPLSLEPFEHLICSHLLSKPLSHKLGMRSIRTLLNDPFHLNSAETIIGMGEKRVWEALEAARTQHRQKTATYLFGMAESYREPEIMVELAARSNNEGLERVVQHIKTTVPGLGVTGASIFSRRIQCLEGWGDALWPYADEKSIKALKEVGVPVEDAEDLLSAIERDIDGDKVDYMGLHEREAREETQLRVRFVVLLERALGCVLEKKVEELRKAAAGI